VHVIAQDGLEQRRGRPLGVGHLRLIRQKVALASELGLPIVSVIDTQAQNSRPRPSPMVSPTKLRAACTPSPRAVSRPPPRSSAREVELAR
jgi:hypothetical protein